MQVNSNISISITDNSEHDKLYIHNAVELALSIGDYQKEVTNELTPDTISLKVIECINNLINFDASVIFLIDEISSDLKVSVNKPIEAKHTIDEEFEFLIENGSVSWAMQERRGILVFSKDSSRQVFLHVMATYSSIRGLFIGIFPVQLPRLPDLSLEIVSLILRNAASDIENLKHSNVLRQKKKDLESQLEQKTQQLLRYEKQLVHAQKMEAITALAGGVAHQFNNALTGLIGNIDLIKMVAKSESNILKYIDRINPITERMSNLTKQLLAYAQHGTYKTQIITLKELFDEVLPAIKQSLGNQIHLNIELTDKLDSVKVDTIQMRMVILAIINNAKEAIVDKGNLQIKSRLIHWNQIPEQIRDELKEGKYICMSFKDNGRGMDDNTLRRIFEPFFSTKFAGRGLSMAAVQGITKQHGGFITISSKIEKGTCVKIYLPNIISG